MPRFRLDLEYEGTRYRGWQIQQNARTVQGEIHRAIGAVSGRSDFEFMGAGRTDAGVHALHQVAHLDLAVDLPPDRLAAALNSELPADINILSVDPAPPRFHARHQAAARSYLYQVSRVRTAFGKRLVWWVREPLQVSALAQAARLFCGMRDFRSFAVDDPERKSSLVLVEDVAVAEVGPLVLIRVVGSHFLWKMVRRMVGVLVEVGKGQLAEPEVARWLSGDSPEPARLTAPPSGLFLERVYYPGEPLQSELRPAFVGSWADRAVPAEKPPMRAPSTSPKPFRRKGSRANDRKRARWKRTE